MAGGNVNSPEYKAFAACTNDICLAVKYSLITVGNSLFASGLITADENSALMMSTIPEGERAAKLVSKFVLAKIQADPGNYHKFVAVLDQDRMQYNHILSKLKKEYKKQQEAHESPTPAKRMKPMPADSDEPDSGNLSFSQSMDKVGIKQWLLQKLTKTHEDNIEKLYENDVDGEVFLTLTENDFATQFGIQSLGFRRKVHQLVKEVSGGDEQQLPMHKVQQQEETKISPLTQSSSGMARSWCSFAGGPVRNPSTAAIKDDAKPAVLGWDVYLWNNKQLSVKVLNPELLERWNRASISARKLSVPLILEWAKKWECQSSPTDSIPKFYLAEQGKRADIEIELNENKNNSSLCGNARPADSYEPTMWLDLSPQATNDVDVYKEHVVVHEFGHTLGLGHEHQRSDFCTLIGRFLNKAMMQRDLGAEAYQRWQEDEDLAVSGATPYDSDSIMHYYFKKEWLKDGYHELDKIQTDFEKKLLTKQQMGALIGVHRADNRYAIKPSKMDLEFLTDKYRKHFNDPIDPSPRKRRKVGYDDPDNGVLHSDSTLTANGQRTFSAIPSQIVPTKGGYNDLDTVDPEHGYLDQIKWKATPDGKVMEVRIYEGSAQRWEKIATKLGLTKAKIEIIRDDKRERKIDCVKAVYEEWLNNASELPKAKDYPLSWQGLDKLLRDSDLAELAKKVCNALQSPHNEVRGTFDC